MSYKAVLWCLCVVLVQGLAQEVDSRARGDEDRVEIIDYKRGKILGFMIVRNGNITKRVLFKEPISLGQPEPSAQPSPAEQPKPAQEPSQASAPTLPTPLESKQATPQPTPPQASDTNAQTTQTIYEHQISNAPKDTKSPAKRAHKASPSIAQEVGVESTRINPTYKNRQWNKKHIIHDISTEEVIEVER